jgi:hypothetical protein
MHLITPFLSRFSKWAAFLQLISPEQVCTHSQGPHTQHCYHSCNWLLLPNFKTILFFCVELTKQKLRKCAFPNTSSFHGPKLVLCVSAIYAFTDSGTNNINFKLKSFYQKMLRLRAGRCSVRLPAEARLCMHLCRLSLLFNKYTGIKRPGRECGHSSPATAQVNKECSYTFTFTPYIMCHAVDTVTVTRSGCSLYRQTFVQMQMARCLSRCAITCRQWAAPHRYSIMFTDLGAATFQNGCRKLQRNNVTIPNVYQH